MLKYNDKEVLIKLAEECSELAVEANKAANGNMRRNSMEEEIAHVRLYIDEVIARYRLDQCDIQKEYNHKKKKKSQ
jgi:phosphoribosyl-ATP pyrophosphohydrolase